MGCCTQYDTEVLDVADGVEAVAAAKGTEHTKVANGPYGYFVEGEKDGYKG